MEATTILRPVFAMGILTTVMIFWVLVTRLPAMSKAGIGPQQAQDTVKLRDMLPPEVSRVSNNYNHLFEQPTLFYAIAISIAVLGLVDALHVQCAWAYVILRIAHSIVQGTVDIVMIRFGLFGLSWVVLATMIMRGAWAIF